MQFEPTKEDLQQIREWIKKSPHIIEDYEDHFLAAVVRSSKGSLQRAKIYIENLNALGMKCDFFTPFDPQYPPLQEHSSVWLQFPLPKKTPKGCTVFFSCINPKSNDPSKSHVNEHYRFLLLSFYVLLWENDFGSGQWIHAADYKDSGLAHMKDLTPVSISQIIRIAESSIPIRLHSITAFNMPKVTEHIFNIFKMVAKTKLAERIFVYSTLDKLKEHVPPNILPKEYGGSEESIFVLHGNWKKKMESYRERLLEEERKMRKLDPLRPLKDEEDQMVGTFRRLNVD